MMFWGERTVMAPPSLGMPKSWAPTLYIPLTASPRCLAVIPSSKDRPHSTLPRCPGPRHMGLLEDRVGEPFPFPAMILSLATFAPRWRMKIGTTVHSCNPVVLSFSAQLFGTPNVASDCPQTPAVSALADLDQRHRRLWPLLRAEPRRLHSQPGNNGSTNRNCYPTRSSNNGSRW